MPGTTCDGNPPPPKEVQAGSKEGPGGHHPKMETKGRPKGDKSEAVAGGEAFWRYTHICIYISLSLYIYIYIQHTATAKRAASNTPVQVKMRGTTQPVDAYVP